MGRLNAKQSPIAKFGQILALDAILFDAIVRLQRLGMRRDASQLQEIREHLADPMSAVQSGAYEVMGKAFRNRRAQRRMTNLAKDL